MTPQIGDIVELKHAPGTRWVFANRYGSPAGSDHYARVVRLDQERPSVWGEEQTFFESSLIFIERPTFEIGQQVTVNEHEGVIVAFDAPQIEGEPRVLIALTNDFTDLAGGGRLKWVGHHLSVPTWAITVEAAT